MGLTNARPRVNPLFLRIGKRVLNELSFEPFELLTDLDPLSLHL